MIRRRGVGVRPRLLNAPLGLLVGRLGVPVPGVRMLRVHGRRTGRLRSVPVLVVRAGGRRYLVAPSGRPDWSRNLAAAGWGELIRGGSVERVTAVPLTGEERERAVGAYIRRHGRLTHRLFGVGRRPDEATIREIAPRHAAFRLEASAPPG